MQRTKYYNDQKKIKPIKTLSKKPRGKKPEPRIDELGWREGGGGKHARYMRSFFPLSFEPTTTR
jgi:hypothetical protein